jgi:phosphoserine phosphatase
MSDTNQSKLIISHPQLQAAQTEPFTRRFGSATVKRDGIATWLIANEIALAAKADIHSLAIESAVDVAVIPATRKPSDFKLAAFDMDSTLITIECIDEIADYIGKKAEVAAITEAAMRGEITDYKDSLRRRVALLKGLSVTALDKVYEERLKLTPGAEKLIQFLQQQEIKVLLVSGGFTFFTDKLKARLGLNFSRSNELAVKDGKLTGELVCEIIDAQAKMETVLATCKTIGCLPSQCIAVGDGANDLKMMAIAGISVAFKAKPVVQIEATNAINFGGLDAVIPWLGQ